MEHSSHIVSKQFIVLQLSVPLCILFFAICLFVIDAFYRISIFVHYMLIAY